MNKPTAFQFYAKDWLSSTTMLNTSVLLEEVSQ